jgi:alpha-glucosidase
VDPLILDIAPAETSDVTYELYEDGSDGRNYETGEFATTGLHAEHKGAELVVRIDPAKGSYKGMLTARAYQLQLPGNWPPASVTVNGKALKYSRQEGTIGWRYDGNQLATIVQTERFATSKPVEIRVKVSPELAARRSELAGFAGAMTRLRASYDALNQTWPLGWSPDDLTDAMQSGNRLTYHPELAGDELKHFHDVVLKAQAAVEATSTDVTPEQAKRIARRMGVDPDSDAAKTRFAEIQTYWQRGHALLGEAVSEAAGK